MYVGKEEKGDLLRNSTREEEEGKKKEYKETEVEETERKRVRTDQ